MRNMEWIDKAIALINSHFICALHAISTSARLLVKLAKHF